jgi:hypothetical protein
LDRNLEHLGKEHEVFVVHKAEPGLVIPAPSTTTSHSTSCRSDGYTPSIPFFKGQNGRGESKSIPRAIARA